MSKTKTKTKDTRTVASYLWVACFSFDRPTRMNGTCQMVVKGRDPDDAMRKCHEKFATLGDTTDLFEPGTKVYTHGVVRLSAAFGEAVLMNWDSSEGSQRIYNLLPDPDSRGIVPFTVKNTPNESVMPFIEFYGESDASDPHLPS